MAIPYKNPGDSLTADEWNSIMTAMDALLANYWGGLSQVLSQGFSFGKHFFFFNPVTPPAGLHPAAYGKLALLQTGGGPNAAMPPGYFRQYNHGAITGLVLGLAEDTNTPNNAFSPTFGVMRLALPSAAYWWATLFPEGGYGTFGSGSVTYLDLGMCLQVLTQLGYPVTFGTKSVITPPKFIANGQVEQVLPWDEINLFINGNLTIPDDWNKYHFFKIHNFDRTPATVIFGSTHLVVIPAGGSQCVRRTGPGGTYTDGGKYYQAMLPGDPRFYGFTGADDEFGGINPTTGLPLYATPGPSVFQPMNLPWWPAGQLGRNFDLRQFINLASAYNAAGLVGTPGLASYMGDLMVMQGKVLGVRYSASGGVYGNPAKYNVLQNSFTGFGSIGAFFAALNPSHGVTWAYNSGTGVITLTPATTDWDSGTKLDLTDLGANLIYFLTGALKLTLVAGGLTITPAQGTFIRRKRCKPSPTATGYNFYTWTLDGTGYHLGPTVPVFYVNTGGIVQDSSDTTWTTYSFMDTPQKMANLVTALSGGGIGSVSQLAVTLTPCGPALTWSEQYVIGPQFDLALLGINNGESLEITVNGRKVTVARGQLITGCGNNSWAPLSLTNFNPKWHFPRVPRCVGQQRTVNHNGANEPWQAVTGTYTTQEPPNVINWYEWNPMRQVSVATTAAALTIKAGFNYLGPIEQPLAPAGERPYSSDSTGLLLYRWLAAGATDAVAYLRANYSAGFFPNGSEFTQIEGAALELRCQAEQYNLCASEANALPVTPAKGNVGNLGNPYFTLDFRSLFLVSGGTGYQVGDKLGPQPGIMTGTVTIQVTSVDANGGITGWTIVEDATPIGTFSALATPQRPFQQFTGTPCHGSGATFDVTSGDGSGLSFVPTYAPKGVPLPSGLAGTYWPRGAYFSWNGATAGGVDPVATYLASLGLTVQDTLPDGYGPAQPTFAYDMHPNGSVTSDRITGYGLGFNPNVAAQAASYRWVTVDDARTLYASLSLPFTVSTILTPQTFLLANVTGTVAPTVTTTALVANFYLFDSNSGGFDPNVNGRNTYADPPTPWSGPGDTTSKYSDNGQPIKHLPDVPSGGGFLGDVNQVVGGFTSDQDGEWVTPYSGANLAIPTSPAAIPVGVVGGWTGNEDHNRLAYYDYALNPYVAGTYFHGGTYNWMATEDYTQNITRYVISYPPPAWLISAPVPAQMTADLTAVIALYEGVENQCVACVPQNFGYYDPNYVTDNFDAYVALGAGIVPIIADNSVEGSPAEVTVYPGAGGAGLYEHLIQTKLANARLVIFGVDGGMGVNTSSTVADTDTGAGDGDVGAGD